MIEIINSRAVDPPNVEQEKNFSSMIAGDVGGPAVALEYSRKSTEGKQEDLGRSIWGSSKIQEKKYSSMITGDVAGPSIVRESSRESTEEKNKDLNTAIRGNSTPLIQSSVSKLNHHY